MTATLVTAPSNHGSEIAPRGGHRAGRVADRGRRGFLVVLFRLAYLGVTNALAMLRLLPMSDRAKDVEILALRYQIMVLERQRNGRRIRFTTADRALLAALPHRLPRTALRRVRLLADRHGLGAGDP